MWSWIRQILALGIPMSVTRLVQMLSAFIGMLILAHLGHVYVAAGSLISATQVTLSMICISLLFATGVISARLAGAGDHDTIGALLQQAGVLSIVLAIPVCLLFWFAGPILSALHQPAALIPLATSYFRLLVLGILPIVLTIPVQQFLFSLRLQKFVLWCSLLNLIMIALLAYMFILGRWGAPMLGVRGLALAYVIQNWISLLIYFLLIKLHPIFQPYRIFQWRFRGNFNLIKRLVQIGWPMSMQFGGEMLVMFFLTMMIGLLGTTDLAARQVVSQYYMLIIVPIFGFSEATSILVSHAHGADNRPHIRKITNASVWVTGSFAMIVLLIAIFFPVTLARVYIHGNSSNDLHIIYLLKTLLWLASLGLLFDSCRTVLTGALRGLYDTKAPMWIGIAAQWLIAIPLGALLAFTFHQGIIGIQAAWLSAIVASVVALWWRWKRKLTTL